MDTGAAGMATRKRGKGKEKSEDDGPLKVQVYLEGDLKDLFLQLKSITQRQNSDIGRTLFEKYLHEELKEATKLKGERAAAMEGFKVTKAVH